MTNRWMLRSGAMLLVFATQAPAQDYYHHQSSAPVMDYYHRDPDRPECRTIRVDSHGRIEEKYMCRGDDGEWHEEAPDGGATDEVAAPRHRHEAAARDDAAPADAAGIVAADTTPLQRPGTYRKVAIALSNIDDLGLVMVIPSMGKPVIVASPQWNVKNQGGEASADIGPHLAAGRNIILFVLHNKRWIFGASKWAFDATLTGDKEDIWHASRLVGSGGVGIQYWKAIYAERHPDGTIKVATLSNDNVTRLAARVAGLNAKLVRDYGTEQSAYAAAAGVVIAGMMSSMAGGDGGGGSGGRTVIYRQGQNSEPEPEPAPEPNTYGLYGNCHNPTGC